ncbi:hypothetical protein SAMN05443270_3021 [Lacrimispora sphenoides]|uniref:hypothetical protein n=1 Tax=Lacrimispora sphenoides TaxID=29370 RepID=UPI0008BC83BE|nr:hypothetical protein [Lacrimispora sphenoides]SEU08420.1 hypothetical protein SAMN05443270_3021 [Lacrimispora sphenoides]
MENQIIDELKIYRGKNIHITDKISIRQPTLGEICDYGEKEYWFMIHTLTSVGADMKFQLYDLGVDYTKIDDYTLFSNLLCKGFPVERTSILFGNLDFSKFQLFQKRDNDDIVMYNSTDDILFDEYTYLVFVDALRKIHMIKRNSQLPANESTKQILIDDDREAYEMSKNKQYSSQLKNVISSMINREGFKCNHDNVWDMKINAFLDSVKRIQRIKDADLLLQSGYSGYGLDLTKISNKKLDWLGELD